MLLDAILTCPQCGHQIKEEMPEGYHIDRYECPQCLFAMTPKEGDDCVYCSYSNTICPPRQQMGNCCQE